MNVRNRIERSVNSLNRLAGHLPSIGRFQPIRGIFSALTELRAGKLEGGLILDRQETGSCPVGSMTEKARFQQHDHQPWPVFWVRSDDARLIAPTNHWRDSQDQLCTEAMYYHPEGFRRGADKWDVHLFLPPTVKMEGAWTSLSSIWNDGSNYYHWLLDGLTRLSVRDHLPEQTRIFIPANPPRFVTETLEMLGLSALTKPFEFPSVKPERFYFCSPTAMTGVRNPMGYDWLRKNFSPFFDPEAPGRRVFLTRRGSARVPHDIGKIEEVFSRYGFEIVDCGKLTVKEQIRKTSGAAAIAGLHGAAMTNLLWARKSTPVLEIFQPGYLNGCYEQIAMQGELKYGHTLTGEPSFFEVLDQWCSKVDSST